MGGRATTRGQAPARSPERKDAITTEAARLFAQHGFSAVGMDDIGAAVGITGPAIYRHFAGKDAVLESVITTLLDLFVAGADEVEAEVGQGSDPAATDPLTRLVATSVTVALDHPSEVATYVRERARLTQPVGRPAPSDICGPSGPGCSVMSRRPSPMRWSCCASSRCWAPWRR
jgi:AcrR family transcriptional regulator